MLRFEQSIQSKYTLRNYKSQIERFLKFTKLKDYDSLVNVPKEDIQMLVEEYAFLSAVRKSQFLSKQKLAQFSSKLVSLMSIPTRYFSSYSLRRFTNSS